MFACCLALLERIKTDRRGISALEYGIIAGALVATLGLAFNQLISSLNTVFGAITSTV